jgi:3-methylfumaryl-CoA hydratase
MFASTSIEFGEPLLIDVVAQSTLTILDVRHKAGRSGDLVFVDVERRIDQCMRMRVTERQSLVYRGAGGGDPVPLPVLADDCSTAPAGGEVWTPGTVNLFRFSSVTFNGHRIHYDLPYASGVEGYPSLVVHGPFIAARLAEMARLHGNLGSFEFRAQSPCFVDQPIRLVRSDDNGFRALRCDGEVATLVKATYR